MKIIAQTKMLKQLLASLAFLFVLTIILLRANTIFTRSFNHNWYIDQRREQLDNLEPGQIDILYIGGSKVSVGIIPIEIWKNTGLKGINIATNTQPPVATKFLLKKYVLELEPKYVLLELAGIISDASLEKSAAYRYPIAIQLLNDRKTTKMLLDDLAKDYPNDSSLEYRYPLYRDHARWKSLRQRDFVFEKQYNDFLLGFVNEYSIKDKDISLQDKVHYSHYAKDPKSNSYSERHYQELVDFLNDQNIEIILISMPDIRDSTERNSRIKIFAENNCLPYVDFSIDPIFENLGFENKGDFYDTGHLSLTGALKFSNKLSVTLNDLIDAETGVEDPVYVAYYEDFVKYFDQNKEKYTVYYD